MRTWLFAGCFAFAVWQAAAQGTVNFANGAAGVDAPVTLVGNASIPEGPQWQAELFVVSRDGSSRRIGEAVPLQSADLAGYFFGGLVVVPDVEAGSDATFQVRAFDTAGTAEVTSNPVQVTLGGGKMPPPNLVGLTSWGLNVATPELKITLSQRAITISWAKDFSNAALEFADSLINPNWSAATETPQTEGNRFTVTMPVAVAERYYRLRLR